MMPALFSPRLLAIIVKEFWAVLRDPKGRIILFVPPVVQLILFSGAATLEVRNVTIGVLNHDGGAASSEFVNQLAGSPNVKRIVPLGSEEELAQAVSAQRVIAALVFDASFSRDIAAHRPAKVQLILDGRRSNAAQIVGSYVLQIAANVGAVLLPAPKALTGHTGPQVATNNWFNPNLDYLWFIMPALVVQIGAVSALGISAQSVARERELGTFDQLMVSPLRTWEIILGKLVPPFAVGLINGTLYLIAIPLFFGVPFTGTLPHFALALAAGLVSVLGIGMLISTLSRTQQQAFLGMFAILPPMILLSGFASPVDNMPPWLQLIAQADPLTHFNVLMEGIFLKAMPQGEIIANVWPLLVIGAVTMAVAVLQFRARME